MAHAPISKLVFANGLVAVTGVLTQMMILYPWHPEVSKELTALTQHQRDLLKRLEEFEAHVVSEIQEADGKTSAANKSSLISALNASAGGIKGAANNSPSHSVVTTPPQPANSVQGSAPQKRWFSWLW